MRRLFSWFFKILSDHRQELREQFQNPKQPFSFWAVENSPLWRAAWFYVWQYPFTPGGKALLIAFALIGPLSVISVDVPMYLLFLGLVIWILISSAVGSVFRFAKISVQGQFPTSVAAGVPITGRFQVVNQSPIPIFDLSAACFLPPKGWEPDRTPRIVPILMPGRKAEIEVTLTPHRRGLYVLPPIRLFTTFPWNIVRNQLSKHHLEPIIVLPGFSRLQQVRLEVGARYQPGGISLTSNIGESPEYIGNREYQPGDSPRRIDFHAWGRLARPVVREYQEEYYCRIALVLDTFVPPGQRMKREGYPSLETAISLIAAVGDALARGEFIIDLFAAGSELHVFRTGRHTAHLDNMLEILACVQHSPTDPIEKLSPALLAELRQVSAVIWVWLGWDEARYQLVRTAREQGCAVKILIVHPHPERLEIPRDLAFDLQVLTPTQIRSGRVEEV